jgi:hypothetical protein
VRGLVAFAGALALVGCGGQTVTVTTSETVTEATPLQSP